MEHIMEHMKEVEYYFKDAIFLDELDILIKKILIENFKLSNVSHSRHYKILQLLIFNYFEAGIKEVSIKELKSKLGVSTKKLFSILEQLATKNLIVLNNRTVALHPILINTIFSLIQEVQNFDDKVKSFIEELEDKDFKLRDLKNIAKGYLKNKKMLGYFEKSIIYALFQLYVYKANSLKIVLKNKYASIEDILNDLEKNATTNDLLILDYKTRFNSEGILKKQIIKLKDIIKEATRSYQYALFITLTTDPNKRDLFRAYKDISSAFKKFRDAVSRRLGEQIKYVKVLEFTKTGLPHLHVLIFTNTIKDKRGNWVLKQDWIGKLWSKYGYGEINRIYALKRQGETYTWLNFKPANAKTNSISNYLSKYLEKAFENDLELMYYWVSNLRFYTYSYNLYNDNKEDNRKIKGLWEFLGAWELETVGQLKEKLYEFNKIKKIKKYKKDMYLERWYSIKEGIFKYWVCV